MSKSIVLAVFAVALFVPVGERAYASLSGIEPTLAFATFGAGGGLSSSGGSTTAPPVSAPAEGSVQSTKSGEVPVQTSKPGAAVTGKLINPLNVGDCEPAEKCIMSFLDSILKLLIKVGTIVIVFMIIYIGFQYVTVAQTNPGKISEVHQKLLWTVVGALVLLGAQAISYGIQETVKGITAGT